MHSKNRKNSLCTDPHWLGRADCKHCGVRHMMLFSGLDASDFDDLLKPIDNLRYASACVLYTQDDADKFVYSIRSGHVKLEQLQLDGSVRIVRLLGRGAIIGLEAFLEKQYRHTATALSDLDVCRIHLDTLKQLETQRPQLSEKLMMHWDQQLAFADRWISEISSGSVRNRVIELCNYLQELSGSTTQPIRFFGFEDMAAMIGASRETFSRAVAELKKEHILTATQDSHEFLFSMPQS